MTKATRSFCVKALAFCVFYGILAPAGAIYAAEELPVTRIALFSSGVGYFEHSGIIAGDYRALLPFDAPAVNDVLKSLIINDPGSSNPSVTYASDDTLVKTLKSLAVDLSGNPGLSDILLGLRGSEVRLSVPDEISGRIVGVESRFEPDTADGTAALTSYLTLFTPSGLRAVNVTEIVSLSFVDPAIARDFSRALDLLLTERARETRTLSVNLPGTGSRMATLGYVIPAPVWKVSYRLDLSGKTPLLQGWAIIDNAGDMDWKNVELTLVTGRPVSFIQNLYPPLYLSRPTIPLSIAGVAAAETYDSGFGDVEEEDSYALAESQSEAFEFKAKRAPAPSARAMNDAAPSSVAGASLAQGTVETATVRSAGDQFLFTVKKPVSLSRQHGAMIPLVEANVAAERVSVFSGQKALSGGLTHPMLCAVLENTTGMKLPAGPITVFEDASYAGDALIEFFPEREKRIIAYGEDLSVTGAVTANRSQDTVGVSVTKGVMTIRRTLTHHLDYTLKNASSRDRRMLIEHPITYGATLSSPSKFEEKTDAAYRFAAKLPAAGEITFSVKEQSPISESIVLTQQKLESLVYYSTSGEIPTKVRTALEKAISFRKNVDTRQTELARVEERRKDRIAEQDRIRLNLEATGSETQQGKEYLRKMGVLDAEIESLVGQIDGARKALADARDELSRYLSVLTIE